MDAVQINFLQNRDSFSSCDSFVDSLVLKTFSPRIEPFRVMRHNLKSSWFHIFTSRPHLFQAGLWFSVLFSLIKIVPCNVKRKKQKGAFESDGTGDIFMLDCSLCGPEPDCNLGPFAFGFQFFHSLPPTGT